MRKSLIAIVFVALLLSGCLGSGAGVINPKPPIETDPDALFDGSPTHLSLEFERNTPGIAALSQSQVSNEPDVAYIRITRTDHENPYLGNVIYNVLRKVELEQGANAFNIDSELPAGRGYVTNSIVIQGGTFLEVSSEYVVDAPAKTITSEQISMEGPQYSLHLPNQMYSGGGLSQIQAKVPERLSRLTHVTVWVGFNPWEQNGTTGLWSTNTETEGWIVNVTGGFLPEVTKPTKLYYQVGVNPRGDLFPKDEIPWPFHYEPNLELGEELPYIWVYPYPGWTD